MTGVNEKDFGKLVSRGFANFVNYLSPIAKKMLDDIITNCETMKQNLDLDPNITIYSCTKCLTYLECLNKIFEFGNKQLEAARVMNPDYPKNDKTITETRSVWDGLHSSLMAALNACKKCYEGRYKVEVTLGSEVVGGQNDS